ncbi:NHL repeat protein [Pelomyxa schiedti]|nr:NHL repeat protein [Pelomyxa schiedti]
MVGGNYGLRDGDPEAAAFRWPIAVAIDPNGVIYVTEQDNHCIRKIELSGAVSTLAGSGWPGFADGLGRDALFECPWGITLNPHGDIIVCDTDNHRIRKITPYGVVSTVAGTGEKGTRDGPSYQAQFACPRGIVSDSQGTLFCTDADSSKIRKISQGLVTTVTTCSFKGQSMCVTGIKLSTDERQLIVTDPRNTAILFYDLVTGVSECISDLPQKFPMGLYVNKKNEVFLATDNSRTLTCIKVKYPSFSEVKPLFVGWRDNSGNCILRCLPLHILRLIIELAWSCSLPTPLIL